MTAAPDVEVRSSSVGDDSFPTASHQLRSSATPDSLAKTATARAAIQLGRTQGRGSLEGPTTPARAASPSPLRRKDSRHAAVAQKLPGLGPWSVGSSRDGPACQSSGNASLNPRAAADRGTPWLAELPGELQQLRLAVAAGSADQHREVLPAVPLPVCVILVV